MFCRLRVAVLRALVSEKTSLQGSLMVVQRWQAALAEGCAPEDLYNWDDGLEDIEEEEWEDEAEAIPEPVRRSSSGRRR